MHRFLIAVAASSLALAASAPGLVQPAQAQGSTATAATPLGPPPPLSVYGQLPVTDDVALSPDGSRVAMVTNKNGQRTIFDYDLATGAARASTIEGAKIRGLFWADADHIVALSSDYELGAEQLKGMVMNLATGTAYIMHGAGNFHRVVYNGKSQFTSTNGWSIGVFDPNSKIPHVLNFDKNVFAWVIRPDASLVARALYDGDKKIWSLQFLDGKDWKMVYTRTGALDVPSLEGLGRDGNSAVLAVTGEDGARHYFEVTPQGTFGPPLPYAADTTGLVYHPVTQRLAGFSFEKDGQYRYDFFDPAMATLPALVDKAFPDYDLKRIIGSADDPRQVIVFAEGHGDPGTYYFVDFRSGKSKVIGETYPEIPTEWVADQESITYKAADGMEIPAIVTYPPGRDKQSNLPLIVLPHGGPWDVHDTLGFDWIAQALASRGYVVLQPNYRGSGGFGHVFAEAGYGQYGHKMQSDLSDGVRFLAQSGRIDPKRVCIVGASYGGYAALAAAALDPPGIWRCAVSIAGLSDIHKTLRPDGWEHSQRLKTSNYELFWERMVGTDPKNWDAISPALHADRVNIPVLMIHGKDDSVVPIEQTYEMRDALNAAHKPFTLVLLNDEDHWLSKAPTRTQTIQATVDFLLKNNPPY